jgi:hypothetical protein
VVIEQEHSNSHRVQSAFRRPTIAPTPAVRCRRWTGLRVPDNCGGCLTP